MAVKNGLGGCTRRARSLPSSYIGLAALSLTRLFLSSPPACVSFRESCQLSPVILVFTVVQLMYMNRYIRDVHMCKGVYSSVFIMKIGLLPSLAGGSERPVTPISMPCRRLLWEWVALHSVRITIDRRAARPSRWEVCASVSCEGARLAFLTWSRVCAHS